MIILRTLAASALALSVAMPSMAADVPEGTKLAENQTFTYWVLDGIPSLDPQINTTTDGSDVLRNLFEGLYNEDAKGNLVPGVALEHSLSDDKLTYTFKLRDNAKWSNGDPVKAGDFVYSWRRLADPATASEYAWYMELMQVKNSKAVIAGDMEPSDLGVRAVDDTTLEVTIETPLPYFPQMLVHASTFPVHQGAVEAHGDQWTRPENMVGNGAYVLTDRAVGERLVMNKSDSYWDAENTVLTEITAQVVNNVNQGLTRYQAGELDYVEMPAGQYPRLAAEFPEQAKSVPRNCSYIYMMNLSDKGPEALKDPNVRKAISYGIDRDIIVDRVLQGGQKASYNWTHWATAGWERPEIEYAEWDQASRMQKAMELLNEAGYGPDNPIELKLQYNTDENHKKIAIAASQMLKPLGINLILDNYEWKVHLERLRNQDFDLARYAWCGDYNEPSTYLDLFASYSGHNNGKFLNEAYDAAVQAAKTADDPLPHYQDASRILADEMPIAPIYHYSLAFMLNPAIKGWPYENLGKNWYGKDMYRVAE
ncbi:peptide ABC transporter substrate-binding protein [Palleronia caenipelagi]|uniref:Peptide ABC transporter substrate-binding protein n=1 Tax=Palleronia caenipelagi TaxID=2489174 RepID=A0A547PXN1_9RHOB|nr:peptide ABC transporter substrate-binding protein [Palleronia caenipelagi]TRD18859.1 peptide ABC transporter substrate-binding protein [Palleronia caenipelagi]